MALNPLVDSRDVRFVLYEMLEVDKINRFEKYKDLDRDIFDATIDLAEQIAVDHIYPANALGDKEGVIYNPATKEVKLPEAYKEAFISLKEAGFPGLKFDPEWGGAGMPGIIYRIAMEYFFSASIAFTMYPSLTIGAADLVKNFTSPEIKNRYLKKMISGEWGGTMCLTEPEAGSNVGALKTKAVRQKDGTFLISGQKIFISAGEHDLYENIIHPVLARIEGDPPGSKGVSMFLVPKYLANPDGSLGKRNDVVCSGIEHKMGIKGSATCTLNFGDNGSCVGYLMGKERKGLKAMFQMMNQARLGVAVQGLAVSSSAYLHAVTYAKNRIQGADIAQASNPDAKSVPIIKHQDIKRNLLWMKSNVEAMRMLMSFVNYCVDLSFLEKGEAADEAHALDELLTPVCKAGNSENVWLITAEAIQIYGGYGFCSDYPVEQLARDSKIISIYEGTTGIQGLTLTLRNILMNENLHYYSVFKKRVNQTIEKAAGIVDEKYISAVKDGVKKMDEVIKSLGATLSSMKLYQVAANATPLIRAFSMLCYAWMHLWSMTIAVPKLKELAGNADQKKLNEIIKNNSSAAFYQGKIISARFYIGLEFRKFFGQMDYILSGETAVTDTIDEVFTGAPVE